MSIAVRISGFLFLFIIITNIAGSRFGYETYSDLESEAKLRSIDKNPSKFKKGFTLILIEHISIIALAIALFFGFSQYNIVLGIIWLISRIGEGSIQIYDKKSYWGLLDLAQQFPNLSNSEKNARIEKSRSILERKNSVFSFAQILFSIGTLSYSILFVVSEVVPSIIGWFGIAAGVTYGFGNGIRLKKPKFQVLWNIGGLLVLLFEIVLGGWLLIFS